MITTSKSLPPVPSKIYGRYLLNEPMPLSMHNLTMPSQLPRKGGRVRMEKHFAVHGRKVRVHHSCSKRIKTLYSPWRMMSIDEQACCRGEFRKRCVLGKKKCSVS